MPLPARERKTSRMMSRFASTSNRRSPTPTCFRRGFDSEMRGSGSISLGDPARVPGFMWNSAVRPTTTRFVSLRCVVGRSWRLWYRWACECSSEDVLETIDEGIATAFEAISVGSEESKGKEGAGTRAVVPIAAPSQVDGTMPANTKIDRNVRMGSLSYVGISVGALGFAGLAIGVPLALRSPEVVEGSEPLEQRSTQPPGIAVAVTGGLAVVAGIAMVVIDLVPRHRTSALVAPTSDGRSAGISAIWRF